MGYGHPIAPRWVLKNRHLCSSRKGRDAISPQIHLWENNDTPHHSPSRTGRNEIHYNHYFACQQNICFFNCPVRDKYFGWWGIVLPIFENMGYYHPIAPRWILEQMAFVLVPNGTVDFQSQIYRTSYSILCISKNSMNSSLNVFFLWCSFWRLI